MPDLLNRQVLVLNRLWQPVNICGAKRAISLLYLGHAQVVECDAENNFATHDLNSWLDASTLTEPSEETLHSVSQRFTVPSVVVLGTFDRLPKRDIKFTRENVFRRDHFTCQYCRKRFDPRDLNIDHVHPRDKGGGNTWDNVVASCVPCNTKKANKLPAQSGMVPMRPPKAPRWRPLSGFDKRDNAPYQKSWSFFLDPKPTKVELSST